MKAMQAWWALLAVALTVVLGICASAAEDGVLEESGGATAKSDNVVSNALDWLACHQMPDGNWSLTKFNIRCTDKTCTGPGRSQRNQDTAATGMATLAMLGAGQTPREGAEKYQRSVQKGLDWLIQHQKSDGDLRGGDTMYSHGFAALALCEAYGLTKDKKIGAAAQKAIDFIKKAQHRSGGGWRYNPGTPGDTSVFGWQMAALRSAELAGLEVTPATLDGAKKYLKSAQVGEDSGRFSYLPGGQAGVPVTAVGLLDSLYLGAKPTDPQIAAGMKVLMRHLPDATEAGQRNAYYWFYATQVMRNAGGEDWKVWRNKLSETLRATQVKEGCAAGSWDPGKPVKETWSEPGGRLMVTSLSTLSWEVCYRYLPIFKKE